MPDEKSPEIDDLLTAISGKHRPDVIKSGQCMMCENPDMNFRDVAKLARILLMEKRHQMPDFKLMTVAKFLGIEVDPEKAHDAMYDIDVTMRIFEMLTKDLALMEAKLEI